jgi:hypothetical protein
MVFSCFVLYEYHTAGLSSLRFGKEGVEGLGILVKIQLVYWNGCVFGRGRKALMIQAGLLLFFCSLSLSSYGVRGRRVGVWGVAVVF